MENAPKHVEISHGWLANDYFEAEGEAAFYGQAWYQVKTALVWNTLQSIGLLASKNRDPLNTSELMEGKEHRPVSVYRGEAAHNEPRLAVP